MLLFLFRFLLLRHLLGPLVVRNENQTRSTWHHSFSSVLTEGWNRNLDNRTSQLSQNDSSPMNDKSKPSSIRRIMHTTNGSWRKQFNWSIINRQIWGSIWSFRSWRASWSSNMSISSEYHYHSQHPNRRHANFKLNSQWFWKMSSASSSRLRQC